MKPNDLHQMMQWVDASLDMLKAYEGSLKGTEVRIRSLLTVVQSELKRDLLEDYESAPFELPTETGIAVDLASPAESQWQPE